MFVANERIDSNGDDPFDVHNTDDFIRRTDINKPVIILSKKYFDIFWIFVNIL